MKPQEQRFELPGLGDPHPEGTALYVLVDEELRNTDSRCAGAHLPAGAAYRVVHVISRWAGGEIRGYILHRGDITVRQPCYSGDWPALDALVKAKALAAAIGGAP